MRSARPTTEDKNQTGMRERKRTLVGLLAVAMFIGCSYARNIEKAAQPRMPQP